MTEERLLEMLSNNTLRKVKSATKSCKVSTVRSKMDIIMRIKAATLKDDKRIRIFFLENIGLFWRMAFVFLPERNCILPKLLLQLKAAVIM